MSPTQTHVNWHVEVVGLEGVSHVSKGLQGVAPAGLLKAERDSRFAIFLRGQRTDDMLRRQLDSSSWRT